MKTTINLLQEKYGPLMTLEALAETLNRSSEGLRVSLRIRSDLSTVINLTKRKLGRRIYFKTEGIAKIIDGEVTSNE
ncbi:MAG: DNA-binding protein [Methylophaga sp.]|nr:DNA-binding protein [Methylophaga sp.]